MGHGRDQVITIFDFNPVSSTAEKNSSVQKRRPTCLFVHISIMMDHEGPEPGISPRQTNLSPLQIIP